MIVAKSKKLEDKNENEKWFKDLKNNIKKKYLILYNVYK
jgi:hypothetical protein